MVLFKKEQVALLAEKRYDQTTKMIKKISIFLLIGAFLCVGIIYVKKMKQSDTEIRAAHSFKLPRWGADEVFEFKPKSDRFKMVHFWATWCAPCITEFPEFLKTAKFFEHEAIEWIAVSLDKEAIEVDRFLKGQDIAKNVVMLFDPKQMVSDLYGSYQFPETFLINAQGKIVFKWVGAQAWADLDFVEKLKQIFKH